MQKRGKMFSYRPLAACANGSERILLAQSPLRDQQ